MLHPDTASGNLSLTDCKKHQLNSLWLKLMKTTNEINSFSPTMLLYHLPDYEQLESIYIKACEILDINPENYEVGNRLEFMIGKGTPFNEIMEFLKNEIEKLELQLANLELAQNEYTNEKQTQIYRYALENINDHTKKLKNEIKNMESQIKALKLKIINELKKVPNEQR
jgi:chromosome segregation ATPase